MSSDSSTRTRISPLRVGILVVVTAAVVATIVAAARPLVSPPPGPGSTGFAAYVDVTATPSYPFETPPGLAQQDVILAFVVASPDDACTPSWGGYYSLDEAATSLELDRRIAQLRSVGGRARVSFGGQANTELASACTDVSALTNAYQSVVDRYDLSIIDLDIEGAALTDSAGMSRRAEAIAEVQRTATADQRRLDVWLTLPVAVSGLTAEGLQALTTMLAAGVDVAGVNGMTMDFGDGSAADRTMGDLAIDATTALHGQVSQAYAAAEQPLTEVESWSRVGMTPMIGQNDVAGEVFTLADAEKVNAFARENGLGLVSMWSANRDSTCQRPLPTVTTVVQTTCSGIDQQGISFADVLGADTAESTPAAAPEQAQAAPTASPSPSARATSPVVVDDPATSPFPIWEPLGTYPGGTKVVWKRNVYQAKWWTSGYDPTMAYATDGDNPWLLVGPVLPGDRPAPLPTLPAGTYDQWDPTTAYVAGTRVQVGQVAYEAQWWSQGQEPGTAVAGGSPWILVYPTQ